MESKLIKMWANLVFLMRSNTSILFYKNITFLEKRHTLRSIHIFIQKLTFTYNANINVISPRVQPPILENRDEELQ